MNELSEAMGLANSTMTRMVDHLLGKGLVCRRPSEEDRRLVLVGLTALGQQVRRNLESARQDLLQTVLAETREDERPAILHALEKLIELTGKALQACCRD
jgi:DNA-binding MarR family transcriptional regulator